MIRQVAFPGGSSPAIPFFFYIMDEIIFEDILKHTEGREMITQSQQGPTKGKFYLTNLWSSKIK